MDTEAKAKAPGLRWIKRKASHTPIWVASVPGYQPRTVNLSYVRNRPDRLMATCESLQAEMNMWRVGLRRPVPGFDGTLKSLLDRYQADPDSAYAGLKPTTLTVYNCYLPRLVFEIGSRRVDKVTGVDLKRWHESWSVDGKHLAASKMMRAVLDAAISYGVMARLPGCSELREALKTASRKLPNPKRRESTLTADQVIALRAAAHADGRPSSALAYALVFETTLRLWDVIGQWWPMDSDLISDVIRPRYGKKWFGLRWSDVGDDLVLRYVPSKTSAKTGLAVTFPLSRAQMVVEELEHWPEDKRTGPVIVSERKGDPYMPNQFALLFRRDCKACGIGSHIWARDLRASGITEGRAAGIATDDAAKVAGHASAKTTAAIYDRAALEAAERFADGRAGYRLLRARQSLRC